MRLHASSYALTANSLKTATQFSSWQTTASFSDLQPCSSSDTKTKSPKPLSPTRLKLQSLKNLPWKSALSPWSCQSLPHQQRLNPQISSRSPCPFKSSLNSCPPPTLLRQQIPITSSPLPTLLQQQIPMFPLSPPRPRLVPSKRSQQMPIKRLLRLLRKRLRQRLKRRRGQLRPRLRLIELLEMLRSKTNAMLASQRQMMNKNLR
jgi:hypothetical protein